MDHVESEPAPWWVLVLVGLLGGLLSGAFGVGGGLVIVPLLVAFAGFDQRRASATSLLAILPTAASGTITYIVHGEIDWSAFPLLTIGAVLGALIGTWLLPRLPIIVLRWAFIALIVGVAIRVAFVVPVRADAPPLSLGSALAFIAIGLAMGIASGLFGIGGGAIAVPAMVAFMGISDLVAKGTSLLVMIPTSIGGSVQNVRSRLVDVRAGLIIGIAASVSAVFGALLALVLPPRLATILYTAFLLMVAGQLAWRAIRANRTPR